MFSKKMMKWILSVTMLVSCLVVPCPVLAFEGGRFWTPYTGTEARPDQNGFFFDLEAVYWTISAAPGVDIGYSNYEGNRRVGVGEQILDPRVPYDPSTSIEPPTYLPAGTIISPDASRVYTESSGALGTRLVMNGNNAVFQSNTMNSRMLDVPFVTGTRVTFGNIRDHHGWMFSGYGLPTQSSSYSMSAVNMVLKDSETIRTYQFIDTSNAHNQLFTPGPAGTNQYTWTVLGNSSNVGAGTGTGGTGTGTGGTGTGTGTGGTGTGTGTGAGTGTGTTPAAIVNPDEPIDNIGYLWAWLPTTWADYDDSARLAPVPIQFNSASIHQTSDNWSTELMYVYRLHPMRFGGLEFTMGFRYWELKDNLSFMGQGTYVATDDTDTGTGGTGTGTGGVDGIWGDDGGLTVLANTNIDSSGLNQIFGPQFGLKYYKKVNRWTGVFQAKFFAGINNQERRSEGILGSMLVDTGNLEQLQRGVYPYIPIGFTHNVNSFGDRAFYRSFSPGVELSLNANWQLTKQVGVQFGFNSIYVGNVIRGAQINNYAISETGSLLGVRRGSSPMSDVFVYGVTVGLTVSRF